MESSGFSSYDALSLIVHKDKASIAKLFSEYFGTEYCDDPQQLCGQARDAEEARPVAVHRQGHREADLLRGHSDDVLVDPPGAGGLGHANPPGSEPSRS